MSDCHLPDPGRFAVLHDAAEELLDRLTAGYTVERRETKETVGGEMCRTVRLIPRTPAAAPVAISFTDVPGLVLRLGRWYTHTVPSPAGGEQPDVLVEELLERVAATVEGGLWERVRRGLTGSWSQARLIGPGFRHAQEALLEPREARTARREGFAAPVQWAPWPRRP